MSSASTRMVTRLFSTHPRNDRTPPPPPSLRGSSRELTAGTPELDVLLTVHLQVCKALLQVAERPGGAGCEWREGARWGARGGGWGFSLQRAELEGGEEHGAGGKRPREPMRLRRSPRGRSGPGRGEVPPMP